MTGTLDMTLETLDHSLALPSLQLENPILWTALLQC